jgi:putative mRNA 3-end processing factor
LLQAVAATGAEHVLVMHGQTEALARYLAEQGLHTGMLETAYGDEDDAAPSATLDVDEARDA